jgi:hypothetical protein
LLSNCPNFEWVPDTLPDFAERNGLDDVKYNAAIEAALRAHRSSRRYPFVGVKRTLRLEVIGFGGVTEMPAS